MLSHTGGRLYLPPSLLRLGLRALIYMASFTPLSKHLGSVVSTSVFSDSSVPRIGDGEMYNYTRDASRCLAILSINTSSSDEKIDLRWFGECSPKHRRHSLMFAEHSVIFADCSLRWLAILRWSFGDTSAMHWWTSTKLWQCIPEASVESRGGVDPYKFLSWFMSVIFLYYFTCMFLSRVYVHFNCLLVIVQCTELDGILHYK